MSAYGFGGMIKKLKENPKTIVFTEGTDARILEAASRLLASNFLTPILIGDEDEIIDAAENEGYNIRGAQIINPLKYDRFEEMVDLFDGFDPMSLLQGMIELLKFLHQSRRACCIRLPDVEPVLG